MTPAAMDIAVTGAEGYLGSAVHAALLAAGRSPVVVQGPLETLSPGSLLCGSALHCAGRLRGHDDHRTWKDNVTATGALLAALPPEAMFVLASSRAAADSSGDAYARSKRAAEHLTHTHKGRVHLLRFTVLVGPSPTGLGHSYLTRMAYGAVRDRVIRIPTRTRIVDLLDVREAAATMVALADINNAGARLVSATSGPLALDRVAESIAAAVRTIEGSRPRIERTSMPSSDHPLASDVGGWAQLRSTCGVAAITLENSAEATVGAIVRLMQAAP